MANGSFLGQKTKITVVRKLKLDDVAREYGQIRPGTESGDFIPDCPFFQEGQEFIVVTGGDQDLSLIHIWYGRAKRKRSTISPWSF